MSRERVMAWRDLLRQQDPPPSHLSPAGARAVWQAALDAVTDETLAQLPPGEAYASAVLVCARTVLTAPVEWCAALLARGTALTLKVPQGQPGWAPALVAAAEAVGLPLSWTEDRAVVQQAELVVAMGTDETMATLERRTPGRLIALGHRFSAALIDRDDPVDDALSATLGTDPFDRVAADLALHDGRGCMSPVLVLSTLPQAGERLAEAMERAEARWPRGDISPIEGATVRARGALAQVTGTRYAGPGWSVHQLPARQAEPIAMPRSACLIRVGTVTEAVARVAPFQRWLSCIATTGETEPWERLQPSRIVRPGHLQRPAMHRIHDGLDWLAETARQP